MKSLSLSTTLWTLGLAALFLLLTALCIGLRTEHLFMVGLFLALFFASRTTRQLAVALLPFVLFAISYDWMRVWPNYRVNPIDVQGLYEAEKSLFGVTLGSERLTLCEYFARHHWLLADLLAGFFYLCWVPVPIAFGLWLYTLPYTPAEELTELSLDSASEEDVQALLIRAMTSIQEPMDALFALLPEELLTLIAGEAAPQEAPATPAEAE